ncbi:MAG TPA: response regulator [Jiangellaceae bacterium]|nr:response regulator [Jiangellaceae bacterium]
MSLRVLVVDDSKVMRQIVIRTLRQAGYGEWTVIEASNGAEALELALAQQPDLVLSDWNMPEMTGIDLLRKLNASGADIPLGFVTSEGSTQMRELAAAEGALFLIAKPFTPDVFRTTIDPFLA